SRFMKVATEAPVAARDLATDSVEGQRGRPSGVMRLDLLKVVGSSPAFLARPEGVSLARAASRSRAVQIWLCVSMPAAATGAFPAPCDRYPPARNYSRESYPLGNSLVVAALNRPPFAPIRSSRAVIGAILDRVFRPPVARLD